MPTTPSAESDSILRDAGKIGAIFLCGFLAAAIMLSMIEMLGAPAHAVQLALIAATVVVYVLIGFLTRTSDAAEFFVAGRELPARANGMAVAAAWTSLGGFAGLLGALYALGFDGLAYPIGLLAGFVLMGLLIVPYLRKLGAVTIPDFFGARYGALPRLLAAIILCVSLFALLVAQLYGVGLIASRFVEIPQAWAVGGACVILLMSIAFGGLRGQIGTQALQYLVIVAALLVPSAWLAFKILGWPLPQFLYGVALTDIARLETTMIERGLATADTLKPHAAPFLQLAPRTVLAIIFCMTVGVASLPHLVMPFASVATVRDARLSVAWAAFFALIIAMTVPAYAAIAKLQVYRLIDKGIALQDIPDWVEPLSKKDVVRIHGTSLYVVTEVSRALKAGATDWTSAAAKITAGDPTARMRLAPLKETVKAVILDAAKAGEESDLWNAYRATVLPAAAKASGNKSGMLTEGNLWIEPSNTAFVVPAMSGMPGLVTGLVAAGALAAALACASGVLFAISTAIGHDLYGRLLDRNAPELRRIWVTRLAMLLVTAVAGTLALQPPADLLSMAGWSFSLAAAGLFPALVLGIWSKRVNTWGATAGMIAGFGLCLAYAIGTHVMPLTFYELTGSLSNASDAALRKFASLQSAWDAAADGDAKAAALAALEAHARGAPLNPGVANWFGIPGHLAAVFAVPLGFLVTLLVSLITPRPWPETLLLVDEMRQPKGPQILPDEPPAE